MLPLIPAFNIGTTTSVSNESSNLVPSPKPDEDLLDTLVLPALPTIVLAGDFLGDCCFGLRGEEADFDLLNTT